MAAATVVAVPPNSSEADEHHASDSGSDISDVTEALENVRLDVFTGVDNSLLSSKYYFFQWMKEIGVEITSIQQLGMVGKTLYDFIGGFPIGEEELEKYIKDSDENDIQVDEENLIENMDGEIATIDRLQHRNYVVQQTAATCVAAFYEICVGDHSTAKETIEAMEVFFDRCKDYYIHEEYLQGFMYFVDILKIHLTQAFPDESGFEDIRVDMEEQPNLPDLAMAMILAIKFSFVTNITKPLGYKYSHHQVNVLRKVLELDPTNWVLQYLFVMRLRSFRRTNSEDYRVRCNPSLEERHAAFMADKYANPSGKAMAAAGLYQCIAECVHASSFERYPSTIQVGELVFNTLTEAVNNITENIKKALKRRCICFAEVIRYGEILSNFLPSEYKNYELAEKCFRVAIHIMPSNSKALHKLGKLHLASEKLDFKKAIAALQLAVEFEPCNFPALIDLLQTIGHFPKEKEVFERKIELELQQSRWTTLQKSNLHFVAGCHFFVVSNFPTAVEHWTAYESLKGPHTKNSFVPEIKRLEKQYYWPELNIKKITEIIENHQPQNEWTAKLIQQLNSLPPNRNRTNSGGEMNQHGDYGYNYHNMNAHNSNSRGRSRGQPRFSSNPNSSMADGDHNWRRTEPSSVPQSNRGFPQRRPQQRTTLACDTVDNWRR